jgi:signal transduction histidine kinase
VVNTDVTEKKQLEAEFLQAQRLESLGILARSIAHDLNNILTPISIAPQLLLKQLPDLDTVPQELLKSIQRAAKRGTELSQQILAFAGKPQEERILVTVNDLIQEIQQFAQFSVPKNIQIRTTLTDSLKPVLVDPTRLYQVLLNLCVNARDAMPQGGTLSLSANSIFIDETNRNLSTSAQPGEYAVITVADTGVGIAPEVLDHIFDPFFTTKSADQGSGLGLSTVAKIVKDCGGFVKVLSEVGTGCQFQVYLPTAKTAAPMPAEN